MDTAPTETSPSPWFSPEPHPGLRENDFRKICVNGLFIGTANPFGPREAKRLGSQWEWTYEDNPRGGLEVWLGDARRATPLY